jgi:hypothetical protein
MFAALGIYPILLRDEDARLNFGGVLQYNLHVFKVHNYNRIVVHQSAQDSVTYDLEDEVCGIALF